jgi:hypothetical protein
MVTILKTVDSAIKKPSSDLNISALATALTALESFHVERPFSTKKRAEVDKVAASWIKLIVAIDSRIDPKWDRSVGIPQRQSIIASQPNITAQDAEADKSQKVYRSQEELRVLDRRATLNFALLFVNRYYADSMSDRIHLSKLMNKYAASAEKQKEIASRFSAVAEKNSK